ncbi:histidine triad nucleotide-binding protein [Ruminococcus sp.]|uniref:histidine triad nucleotide-binding protein n=1 Tax=Ruminococcus sp. TaxID=41978 RepID=UPI00260B37A1|nr:histidine triad nucleotide-binding protein [Ruminococcus sp.]MDD6989759.1 histidine triad nucleotide-binding protein [Ruminococcus sp.]MDY6201945.1 histidine triad nucleotide-binding protein [Ruminococcus sp.]
MADCIFCKIVDGSIPSKKVYEDDKILAFYDLEPQAPVHVLVIPRQHICCANAVDESNAEVIAYIFTKIPEITKTLGLDNGYRIVNNCGDDGCQSVKHMHFHILGGKKLNGQMA